MSGTKLPMQSSGAPTIFTVSRSVRSANFSVVANDLIRHPRLSHEAKSVLTDLLSHTDQFLTDHHLGTADGYWRYAERAYQNHLGRNAYGRVFRELEAEGFITRKRVKAPGNGPFGWDIVLHDQSSVSHDSPSAGFQPMETQPLGDQPSNSSIQQEHQQNLDKNTGVLAEAIEQPENRAVIQTQGPAGENQSLESSSQPEIQGAGSGQRPSGENLPDPGSDQSWLDKFLPGPSSSAGDPGDAECAAERPAGDTKEVWFGRSRKGDPYFTFRETRKKWPSDQGTAWLSPEQREVMFGDDWDAKERLLDWCAANGREIPCRATILPRVTVDHRRNVKSFPSVTFGDQQAGQGESVIYVSHDERSEYLRLLKIGHAATSGSKSGMDLANEMATRWLQEAA